MALTAVPHHHQPNENDKNSQHSSDDDSDFEDDESQHSDAEDRDHPHIKEELSKDDMGPHDYEAFKKVTCNPNA